MKEITVKAPQPNPRLRRIEERHNALVKELRRAFARGELTSDGYCAIEGIRILEEAIRSGLRFRAVFFNESAAARAERLLSSSAPRSKLCCCPTNYSPASSPAKPRKAWPRWRAGRNSRSMTSWPNLRLGPLLVIAGVQDPGNLGTILRSAEAFGAGGVVLGEGTVSPSIPRLCGPRRVRCSGCRWRGPNSPRL